MRTRGTSGATVPSSSAVPGYLYAQRDGGLVADWNGSTGTDNTAALTALLARIPAYVGPTLIFELGGYYFANGITNLKGGLRIEGMGTYGAGPGSQIGPMGVHLITTASGKWCWTQGADATANDMHGCHFKNLCFTGSTVSAGGLQLWTGHNLVENCAAFYHTASGAIGFNTIAPTSPGDSAPLNKFLCCTACDCMIGFQAGGTGSGGAQYTHFIDCFAQKFASGGIQHQGCGIRMYDNGSVVMGGHFESHDIGIECLQTLGCRIIGPFFESNTTTDVALARASGTSSTRNLVIVSADHEVTLGAYQFDDIIIGGYVADSGTRTFHMGANSNGMQIPYVSGTGTPAASYPGMIVAKDNKLYYHGASGWYVLTGAGA